MARKIFPWAVLLLFVAFILFAGGVKHPLPYRSDIRIIAFGDSITYGYGVPPDKNYVSLLSKNLGLKIENAGMIGDTTATALLRMDRDILQKNPDIVILFLGGNDFLQGVPPFAMAENLKNIVKKLQQHNIKIVLVGISYEFLNNYEREYGNIARETKTDGYAPNALGSIVLRPDLMTDRVHPNEKGHEIIASRIKPVLERVLKTL